MKRITSKVLSLVLSLALLMCMMPITLSVSALPSSQTTTGGVVTTPGATQNYKYFKEDTNFDMTSKVDTPMTFEFELAGCANIAGATKGGVIIGNYSEDASSYINIEAADYGKLIVRGKYNNGSEWTAQFYNDYMK